jgi:hypothetical protein
MANSLIRNLYKQKYPNFGTSPNWVYQYRNRADGINQNLGLGSWSVSKATNPIEDIRAALDIAIKSKYLYGLYESPKFSSDGRQIIIVFEKDLYKYDNKYATRMIEATLASADINGKLALPNSLQVQIRKDRRSLVIFYDL